MPLTAKNLNDELKRMGHVLEFWYDRSARTWVISGINKNGDYFSRSTFIFRLDMLTFDEWINDAISYFNTDSA